MARARPGRAPLEDLRGCGILRLRITLVSLRGSVLRPVGEDANVVLNAHVVW
jgi:hypothetical protein